MLSIFQLLTPGQPLDFSLNVTFSERERRGVERGREREVQALADTFQSQLGLFCYFCHSPHSFPFPFFFCFWLAPITYDTVNPYDKVVIPKKFKSHKIWHYCEFNK